MALAPEDKYVVLGLATQIYCARIMAGTDNPDVVACSSEARQLYAQVERGLAPKERRERPPEVSIGARHRG
jgi:hypothetical protein